MTIYPYFQKDNAEVVLGAIKSVLVSKTGSLSVFNKKSMQQIAQHLLLMDDVDCEALPEITPTELTRVKLDATEIERLMRVMAVAALIEGVRDQDNKIIPNQVNNENIEKVLAYAAALSVENHFVDQLKLMQKGDFDKVHQKATELNFFSVLHRPWPGDDVHRYITPYKENPDSELEQRFLALENYSKTSLGYQFWKLYGENNYYFPGNPEALNLEFATPHDSTHILAGYNTKFSGEILVSTFTALMHDVYPLSGHIFIVVMTWQLSFYFNDLNQRSTHKLILERFWEAYARGAQTTTNVFSPEWDFWQVANQDVATLREQYGIPALKDATMKGILEKN